MTPDISVSIVSYNTCGLLHACLGSLQASRDAGEVSLEVIVADNGSTDGTLEMVERDFPWVRRVVTGGNIGYGRANNAALADAQGRYYFILNSDTEVEGGALSAMRDYLDSHQEIGMVGAQLVLPDGSIQRSCATDPGLLAVLWEQIYLDKLFPNNPITGAYAMTHWDYRDSREVQQVCGACFFVRKEAYRQIGGFDPAYYMYFEDTDFCVRLRKAGWPIYFFPQARIKHHLGASSGRDWRIRAQMISSYNQSRYYYFHRYRGKTGANTLKALVLLGAGLRLIVWSLIALAHPKYRQQVQIFHDVFGRSWSMKSEAGP